MELTLDGRKVHYTDSGEGRTLLVLQGWAAPAEVYASVAKRLEGKMRVVIPDMPGFGATPEPEEAWGSEDYARFVRRFLTELGIEEAYVMGHSNGGRIAMHLLTGDDPFSAPRLILCDSAGIVPKKSLKSKISLAGYKTARVFLESAAGKKLFPGKLDEMRSKRGSADYKNASPVMRATLVRLVNEDLRPLMPLIKQPTLLFWGTADTATPLSDAHVMEKLFPDAGLVTAPGAGHYAFLDAPELFGRVLESFLEVG